MNSTAEKILYRKAALIFEELGFLMPRPDSGASIEESTNAVVSFSGPFSGYLMIHLSTGILAQLSANMLGDEQQSHNEVLQKDSLKEIANVICGNVLPAIYGFDPIFHLDAPLICEKDFSMKDGAEYGMTAQVRLSFDSGSADIHLFADKRAPVIS